MNPEADKFEEDFPLADQDLVLDLDGFEGPIDLLLNLARQQKVDLTRISILRLAEQYLEFIAAARRLRLEIAADYLVMAAWLAYLKSRLLLPEPETGEETPAPELADALALRLRRLEAMRNAGENLLQRPRLGRDVFARGSPEGIEVVRTHVYEVSLFELLKAYGDNRRRIDSSKLTIETSKLYSLSDALERLSRQIGHTVEWTTLAAYFPEGLTDALVFRSAVASTLAASLELVRDGKAAIRQSNAFGPIQIRGKEAANG